MVDAVAWLFDSNFVYLIYDPVLDYWQYWGLRTTAWARICGPLIHYHCWDCVYSHYLDLKRSRGRLNESLNKES